MYSGTGYDTAVAFVENGATIIMACRSPERTQVAAVEGLRTVDGHPK